MVVGPTLPGIPTGALGPVVPETQAVAVPQGSMNLTDIRASQEADIKAFQSVLTRRLADIQAIREMQEADLNTITSLESMIHQVRLAAVPGGTNGSSASGQAGSGSTQQAAYQVPQNLSSQVETLTEQVQALSRQVKSLAERQARETPGR